jgi:hypothetical protein
VTERRIVEVPAPSYGWEHPWPNAFEIADVFPTEHWTLVGGLMVQLQLSDADVAALDAVGG